MSLRAALYTRVSTEEQAEVGLSIPAQLHACRQYCEAHGWQVVGEYVDEGKSARVDDMRKRPAFQRMMQAAASREFDLLVVHKIDRFSRNRRIAFDAFDRLGKAGIGFVSISENMDFSAAWGQFALTMLVGLAVLYSDNLSVEFRKGKRERKRQGNYNGQLPYGYLTPDQGKSAIHHPERAPRLLQIFRWSAQGLTDRRIAVEANGRGWRTDGHMGSNLWRKDTVRRVLANRFYLGELPLIEYPPHRKKGVHVGWQSGKHLPLVDADLFSAAQLSRDNNTLNRRALSCGPRKGVYPLTGLLYCARCGQAMRLRSKVGHSHYARCYGAEQGLGCDQPSAPLVALEEMVADWLLGLDITEEAVQQAIAGMAKAPEEDAREAERRQLSARLERIKELYGWGDIGREEYLRERGELQARLRSFAPATRKHDDLYALAALARHTQSQWGEGNSVERNGWLRGFVERITVNGNRVEAIIPRPDLAHLVPPYRAAPDATCGSDGICYPPLRWGYSPTVLREIAVAPGSYADRARRFGVHTSTVQRAVRLYGSG